MAHTDDDLREYADHHLYYEIWMASALTERMKRHAALFDGGLSPSDGALAEELLELPGRNADIESFAMHVRNLVWFLYPKKRKLRDVVAADYFDEVHDWTGIRPVRPDSLALVNQRVPVEVAHLGFGRLRRKDKTWPYEAIWRDLATLIGLFLDNVPEDRVSTEFRDAAKALLPSSPQQKTLRDTLLEMKRKSLVAGVGATTAPPYLVPDDPTAPFSSAGTATMPPKPEPPGFGD